MRRWLDMLRLRLGSVFRRSRADEELDRELRAHLEYQVEENVARGMSAEDARRRAISTFGGVERVREEARDARGVAVMENLARDLRYSLRGLLREPMLLVAATVSIALGVGGNLAVFSLAREFVFAPPSVRRPAEVVQMEVSHGSHVDYQRWLDLNESGQLAGIAGYSFEKQVNWLDGDAAVSIIPMMVTANFFDVTGMPVARGRAFTGAEARAEDDPRIAVVSHEFWQRKLGGDVNVVGRALTLNGESYTILGVLAPRARSVAPFGITPGVYAPLNRQLVPELMTGSASVVKLLGRLKPGQTLSQGRELIDVLDRRLGRLRGDSVYAGVQEFSPAGSLGPRKASRIIGGFFALLGVVSFLVLLIACANVAGLLVARGTRRRQEIAIRLAIGGSRGRVLQQFLAEGFWLALIGTAGGIALSTVFMRVVNSVSLPVAMPIELHLAPDRALMLTALGLVLLTILLCAVLPAISATRLTLVPALKREEPFFATRRLSMRGVLLVGQVTVSTVLLVTAFLFLRNLGRTQVTNPGFEVNHMVVAQLGLVEGRPSAEHISLLERAIERVEGLPEVEQAAFTDAVPLTMYGGASSGRSVRIDDRASSEHVEFSRSLVGPDYFSTMGIPLRGGREFRRTDTKGAPAVVVVNEEFARRLFAGRSPVGSQLRFDQEPPLEIVGVVANGKHQTLGEDQRAALYFPIYQYPEGLSAVFVLARTRADPSGTIGVVRQALGSLDRSVSVQVEPMQSALRFAMLPSRIGAAVLGSLGLLGLILAAFGLYALVSYSVSRRVGEIAIRSALGATRGGILRLVVRDAALLVAVGLVLGLALSALVTAPLATFLVTGLSATDPVSFLATAVVFLLVSLLASWLPAKQATRVSPVIAMRLD
jgi:putative ABC transport system permease protein